MTDTTSGTTVHVAVTMHPGHVHAICCPAPGCGVWALFAPFALAASVLVPALAATSCAVTSSSGVYAFHCAAPGTPIAGAGFFSVLRQMRRMLTMMATS